MKHHVPLVIASVVLAFGSSHVLGQVDTTQPGKEETVTLNPFQVSEKTEEGYVSSSATAVGRISQSLDDIPQEVHIINSAMIADMKVLSLQDVLSYDSGVDF